jgi:hypothetical protein
VYVSAVVITGAKSGAVNASDTDSSTSASAVSMTLTTGFDDCLQILARLVVQDRMFQEHPAHERRNLACSIRFQLLGQNFLRIQSTNAHRNLGQIDIGGDCSEHIGLKSGRQAPVNHHGEAAPTGLFGSLFEYEMGEGIHRFDFRLEMDRINDQKRTTPVEVVRSTA